MLEATKTLFPHKYMAGDAIKLALNALGLNLEPGSYMVDVVASQLDADRILRMIRKQMSHQNQLQWLIFVTNVNQSSLLLTFVLQVIFLRLNLMKPLKATKTMITIVPKK